MPTIRSFKVSEKATACRDLPRKNLVMTMSLLTNHSHSPCVLTSNF